MDRFALQDSQYNFPYHFLPHLEGSSTRQRVKLGRQLRWGREYICYLLNLVDLVEGLAPGGILDVGCGDGRFLGMLQRVPRRVGVDLSTSAIRFAKAFHPEVEFLVAGASELREAFDAVVAIEVLEHIPEEGVSDFLLTLADRCRSGGHTVISVPTKNVPLTAKHYRHYDLETFDAHLHRSNAPLRIVKVDYVYFEPAWVKTLARATNNSWFRIEVPQLDRALWQFTWRHLRRATAETGHHMVVTLAKD